MRRVYFRPKYVLDVKIPLFILDGNILSFETFPLLKGLNDTTLIDRLAGFEEITQAKEFYDLVNLQATDESVDVAETAFLAEYGGKEELNECQCCGKCKGFD